MRKLETGRKQLLKGTRFLLLRGLENLSLEHLMQLMEEPLYQTSSRRRSSGTSPTQRPAMPSWMPGSSRPAIDSSPGSPAPFNRPGLLDYFKHRDRSKDSTTRLRSSDEPMVSETWTTSSSTSTSSMPIVLLGGRRSDWGSKAVLGKWLSMSCCNIGAKEVGQEKTG